MSDKEKNPIEELNALPRTLRPLGEVPVVAPVEVDPMERPLWEIDKDFLNPYQELPPIQTWCRMGDRPALPKEGIIAFSAKQKKGKSLSTYALIIPLLSGVRFDTVTPLDRPRLVIVFDMEMSEVTLTKRVSGQIKSIGEHGLRFVVCSLKSKSIEDRLRIITEKIEQYNPDIAVIDQSAKLVYDINNPTECNEIAEKLDKLSIGRSLWAVMHENKGENDSNMRGHLGSYLSFAAVESYNVDRKNGVFTVTPREARDTDTDNAAVVSFTVDDDGRIVDATRLIEQNKQEEAEKWLNDFSRIFGNDAELSYAEMVRRVQEQLNGASDATAEIKIRKARETGVIVKVDPSKKRSPYRLAQNPNPPILDFDDLDNL